MAIFLLTRREGGLGCWGMQWRGLPSPIASRLNKVEGLEVDMVALSSGYWGQEITVTGLLTGQDLLAASNLLNKD